jgi:hypothetical protein
METQKTTENPSDAASGRKEIDWQSIADNPNATDYDRVLARAMIRRAHPEACKETPSNVIVLKPFLPGVETLG